MCSLCVVFVLRETAETLEPTYKRKEKASDFLGLIPSTFFLEKYQTKANPREIDKSRSHKKKIGNPKAILQLPSGAAVDRSSCWLAG
jgi:hypothetical protein